MIPKILIIEDHDDFRKIVKDFLKKQEFEMEIFEVSSGEAGLEIATKEKPDIVLMDLRLPNMNGIETASFIKKAVPECTIIVLTMFETEGFRKALKTNDISKYLGKSEIYEQLIPQIKKILKEKEKYVPLAVHKSH